MEAPTPAEPTPTAVVGDLEARLSGLLGVAALGLVLRRAGVLPGGFLAVDLVGALAGFAITRRLIATRGGVGGWPTALLGSSWRRLGRAVLVVVGVVALSAAVASPAGQQRVLRGDVLAAIGGGLNWRVWAVGPPPWAPVAALGALRPLWVTGVLVQAALAWTLVVVAVTRTSARAGSDRARARRRLGRLALGGALAGLAVTAALAATGASALRLLVGTDTHAPALLLGAAVAAVPAWFRWTHQPAVWVAAAAVTVALWLGVAPDHRLALGGGLVASAVASAVLVSSVAAAPHPLLARSLRSAPSALLGGAALEVVLLHGPVAAWVDRAAVPTALRVTASIVAPLAAGLALAALPPLLRPGTQGASASRALGPPALVGLVSLVFVATGAFHWQAPTRLGPGTGVVMAEAPPAGTPQTTPPPPTRPAPHRPAPLDQAFCARAQVLQRQAAPALGQATGGVLIARIVGYFTGGDVARLALVAPPDLRGPVLLLQAHQAQYARDLRAGRPLAQVFGPAGLHALDQVITAVTRRC